MADTLYQIHVRDTTGARIAIFKGAGVATGGLESFGYRKRLRTPGEWYVRFVGEDPRIELLELDDGLNHIWEFWRRDPAGGLDWYKDFSGLHRSDRFQDTKDGRIIYTARGRGLNDLLGAETIRYDAGTTQASKSGAAETVAKEFVDENIGPGAPAARQLDDFTVEADGATGATWSGSRPNKQLYDILIELADFAPGDFNVVDLSATTLASVSDPPSFQFQWRADFWGEDRREGNTAGNPPVIFSKTRQNATGIEYLYSRLDEVNVIYALGQGYGTERAVRTRTASDVGIDTTWSTTKWGRRAASRSATSEQTNAALDAVADETLYKQRIRKEFTFSALSTPATRYGRDWDYGDLVTVQHRGESIDQKIVGVTVAVSANGEISITPEAEAYID